MFRQSLLLILEKGHPPLRAAVLDVLLSRSLSPGNQAFIPRLCSDKVTLLFGFVFFQKATDRNTLSSPGIASLLLTSPRFRGLQKCPLEFSWRSSANPPWQTFLTPGTRKYFANFPIHDDCMRVTGWRWVSLLENMTCFVPNITIKAYIFRLRLDHNEGRCWCTM